MPPTKYQVVSPSAGISCHAWNADKSSESLPSYKAVGWYCRTLVFVVASFILWHLQRCKRSHCSTHAVRSC